MLKNIRGRWAVVALAAAVACATPAATSASARSEKAPPPSRLSGEIRLVSHTASRVGLEALIKNFNVAYPRIKVESSYIPTGPQLGPTLLNLINTNPPDVFFTNPARGADVPTPVLGEAEKLLDLTKRPFVKRIPKQDREVFFTRGRVYAAPIFKVASGINYNATEFRRRGWSPPRTFNQLLQLCGRAKAAGINLIALPGQSGQEVVFAVSAGTVYSADRNWDRKRLAGRVKFAGSPLWERVFRKLIAMRDADCFQPGWQAAGVADMINILAPGRAVAQLAPTQGISTLKAARPDVEWKAIPFPGDTAAQTRGMLGYNFALSVSRTTRNRAAALAFLDFAGRSGQSRLFAELSGSISLIDANAGRIPPTMSAYGPLIKAGKIVGRPSSVWPTPSTLQTINTGMGGILTGGKSIREVLEQLDDTWGK